MCYLVFSLKEEGAHSKPPEYVCEGEGVGSQPCLQWDSKQAQAGQIIERGIHG